MSYAAYERWKTVPQTENIYLSVIIPAYNEEIRIIPTIGAIASHVSGLGFSWELIISDDGSKDDTVALVEELALANLRVIQAPQNEGKGSAVRRGMLAADGDFVLFADADNSTPIEEVEHVLAKLTQDGYDIAVGSRAAGGAQEAKRSLLRRVMSGGLRWIVSTVFKIGVQDTQCGNGRGPMELILAGGSCRTAPSYLEDAAPGPARAASHRPCSRSGLNRSAQWAIDATSISETRKNRWNLNRIHPEALIF
jgi:dolichyl-phosphate beta-glucosyltransferase